jgi:hypothetical protein
MGHFIGPCSLHFTGGLSPRRETFVLSPWALQSKKANCLWLARSKQDISGCTEPLLADSLSQACFQCHNLKAWYLCTVHFHLLHCVSVTCSVLLQNFMFCFRHTSCICSSTWTASQPDSLPHKPTWRDEWDDVVDVIQSVSTYLRNQLSLWLVIWCCFDYILDFSQLLPRV